MAYICDDCDRSFVEEHLFTNHQFVVHADKADDGAAPAAGASPDGSAAPPSPTPANSNPADPTCAPHAFSPGAGEGYGICTVCSAGPYHVVHNARVNDAHRKKKKEADMASLEDFIKKAQQDNAVQVRPGAIAQSGDANDVAPAYYRSIFAVDIAPERRRVVEITGEPGSFQTQVVSDYNTLYGVSAEIRQLADVMAGVKIEGKAFDGAADTEDNPDAQNYLMSAWQAIAMFLSSCDDDDKAGALQALKMISNLMSGEGQVLQPQVTGAFNTTAFASQDTWECPQCKRSFSTEGGMINHLKNVHNAREKETTNKTESD